MENIYFKIGQPSTGKSYSFEKSNLLKKEFKNKDIEYLKIPVSGGIGNEYKGLQNTDLALSYDPINQNIKYGEFLQMLMQAIVTPNKDFIIFLDDFHNQDISSLLSEYTPLFKAQQKVNLKDKIQDTEEIKEKIKKLKDQEEFDIKVWNDFIDNLDESIAKVPITNRISGESLMLVYPSNFYLFGAANFNEKTTSIFADWVDRAKIEYIDPLEQMIHEKFNDKEDKFIVCIKKLNDDLKETLEDDGIFDYEKYCFGIWKIVDENDAIVIGIQKRKKQIEFLFSMIKNSLIYNNKNSYINDIGKILVLKMQKDSWFEENMAIDINDETEEKEINKVLHQLGIYEN